MEFLLFCMLRRWHAVVPHYVTIIGQNPSDSKSNHVIGYLSWT